MVSDGKDICTPQRNRSRPGGFQTLKGGWGRGGAKNQRIKKQVRMFSFD
jgi:hypothetical protein